MAFYPYQLTGQQYITDLTSVTGLNVPPSTNAAIIEADVSYVKFWLHGTPTNTSGMVLKPYEPWEIEGSDIANAKFIRKYTSSSPHLAVTYLYKSQR